MNRRALPKRLEVLRKPDPANDGAAYVGSRDALIFRMCSLGADGGEVPDAQIELAR